MYLKGRVTLVRNIRRQGGVGLIQTTKHIAFYVELVLSIFDNLQNINNILVKYVE